MKHLGDITKTDGRQRMKKLYLMTTQDKFELPLAVADSPRELARMTGAKASVINEAISRRKTYTKKGAVKLHPKWHRVEIEEGDTE